MKNSKFKINIWDLLQSAGKIDQIDFKNETINDIKNLSKKWIDGSVLIQSFDQDSLLVTLENLTTDIEEPCDICNNIYTRHLEIDEYIAKFQRKIDKADTTDDEIFPIDWNENIDIKDMIIQSILLKEPISKRCEYCLKESENWDDEYDYLEWNWNITFS